MSDTIYIIGHKHPDTDSIASAYAYAALKRRLGYNVVAGRLGTLNEETKYATRVFKVEAPIILNDARCQIDDIPFDKATKMHGDESANSALNKIKSAKNKAIFVVNDDNELEGIISSSDLATLNTNSNSIKTKMLKKTNIKILAKDTKGKVLNKVNINGFDGKVNIVTDIKKDSNLNSSLCIIDNNNEIINKLIQAKPKIIIVSTNKPLTKTIVDKATKNNCILIQTKMKVLDIAQVIDRAIPIKYIMSKKPITFYTSEYVDDVASKIVKTRFRSYPVLNEDKKVVGAISRYHLFQYKRKKFILVDHSSKYQSIDYIDDAEILEIIDHHHIGNIETTKPILFRNQLCGCTSTIINQLYKENNVKPTKQVAGMMLSAIISDTLNFKSKTTTQLDKDTAKELARKANVNLDKYALDLLNASVNLKEVDPHELLMRDLKTYIFNKKKIAIGQTNYNNIEDIQSRVNDFKEALKQEQERNEYDLIIMMFTHVMAEGTMFLFVGSLSNVMGDIIQTIFDENSGYDANIMSRKQQLVPVLSEIIKNKL